MKRFFITLLLLVATFLLPSWNLRKPEKKAPPILRSGSLCGTLFTELLEMEDTPVPLHAGLGDLHYTITTAQPQVQKYFDQGLRLVYGFNHVEALRSFREASRLDPTCAMTYWGQALSLGPNINDWNPRDREEMANKAMMMARKFSKLCSQKEKDFIVALSARYNGKSYDVRDSLNNAYTVSMQSLSKKYPDDPEILTLYADALMMGSPWDYYLADGSQRPNTAKARVSLEHVIQKYPKHPGANHLYIHLLEASQRPDEALTSAKVLETAMPSAGHIVHMPSHIYVRVGAYEQSNRSNIEAVKADEAFLAETDDQGMYRLGYYPHNIDFLSFGGLMNGQSEVALQNASKLALQMRGADQTMALYYDFFVSTPMIGYIRFGKWNEILALPEPDKRFLTIAAIHHFGRGTAFVRKGKWYEAEREMKMLDSIAKLDTLKSIYAFYNSAAQIAGMANSILKGEYHVGRKNFDEGFRHLAEAVKAEDGFKYNEPPDWRLPARHFLGAALLDAGKSGESEAVYLEDLKKNPGNGWSLQGLYQAQKKSGKKAESEATLQRFKKAWESADIAIESSRF